SVPRVVARRQRIDGILERDRAQRLQLAPNLYSQVGGVRRQLVDQQQPAARDDVGNGGVGGHDMFLSHDLHSLQNFFYWSGSAKLPGPLRGQDPKKRVTRGAPKT